VGYWASTFIIIVLKEHFIFHSGKASLYDISTWNTACCKWETEDESSYSL
ncbi:hypothetical protein BS47DRAFT_1310710, partial [Hydnum rufescens UP504]